MLLPVIGQILASQIVSNPGAAVIADWAARVVTNGGAAPSTATKTALNTFYNGLISAGLSTKFKSINCFVPDNLIASLTPLIVGTGGNDPWTNNGPFTSGDLTVNGLTGNGSSKYLDTGLQPKNIFVYTNMATTQYLYSVGTGTSPFGSTYQVGGPPLIQNNVSATGYLLDFPIETAVACRINLTFANSGGYFCNNRAAANSVEIFRATSAVPHASIGTNTNTCIDYIIPNNRPFFIYAVNINTSPGQYFNGTISFMSFHDSVTIGQSAILYSLVQTMRQQLGGGYI